MLTRHSEHGATAVEYAITILVISIALIFGAVQLGPGLGDVMDDVGTAIGGTQSGPGDDDGTPADCSLGALVNDGEERPVPPLQSQFHASAYVWHPLLDAASTPALPSDMSEDALLQLTAGTQLRGLSAATLKHFYDCGGTLMVAQSNTKFRWHVPLVCADPSGNPLPDPATIDDSTDEGFYLKYFAQTCANGITGQLNNYQIVCQASARSGDTATFSGCYDESDAKLGPYHAWNLETDPAIQGQLSGLNGTLANLPGYSFTTGAPTAAQLWVYVWVRGDQVADDGTLLEYSIYRSVNGNRCWDPTTGAEFIDTERQDMDACGFTQQS